ncbi:MAG: hypothetical protein HAW67_08055, partial [Endozoicomonadaceae bacterium]|nr:hypothetical protein [Endozoicomonadaceae bacterium]
GPHSYATLQFVKKSEFEMVIGNHEYWLLNRLKQDDFKPFSNFEYKIMQNKTDWLTWLYQLPTYIETHDFIAVHAGLQPGLHPKDTETRILTNIRTWDGQGVNLHRASDPAWFDFYEENKLIVFGHWAARGLIERPNVIGLDSGCVYGYALSALIFPSREIAQVLAKKQYARIR